MKKIVALLLCLGMVLSMTACSLFASGNGQTGGSTASEVKITDQVTHKDPEGLEFATRYAYYSGDTCALADMIKEQYDATATGEYVFIYADKDDTAVAEYSYFVFASEEDAQKYADAGKQFGLNTEVMGNVTCNYLDQAGVATNIESFIAWNVLTDYSAKAYAENYRDMDGLVEYNPE